MLAIPSRELDALQKLAECGVQYLLIGGYALRYHGVDRNTDDVDLAVGRSTENARRLHAAITNMLGHEPDFHWSVLTQPKKHINFVVGEPNIDILTTLPGIEFDRAFADRVIAVQDGVEIPVIAKCDLITLKQAIAVRDPGRRERELRDVELLENEGAV